MYIYKCVYNCVNSICKQDYSLWSLETATPEKYLLKSCWLVIQKAQIQVVVWIGQEGASLELSTSVQTTSIHCESEVKWLEGGRSRARTWEEGGGGVLKIVLCHPNQNRSHWPISIVSLTCKFYDCFRFFFGISIFTTRRDPKNFKQYMLIQHFV